MKEWLVTAALEAGFEPREGGPIKKSLYSKEIKSEINEYLYK